MRMEDHRLSIAWNECKALAWLLASALTINTAGPSILKNQTVAFPGKGKCL